MLLEEVKTVDDFITFIKSFNMPFKEVYLHHTLFGVYFFLFFDKEKQNNAVCFKFSTESNLELIYKENTIYPHFKLIDIQEGVRILWETVI